MNLIDNSTNLLIQSAMSGSMTRQNAISQNIANVDTPNYKAKKVVFSQELTKAQDRQQLDAYRTNERHLDFSSTTRENDAKVVVRNNTQYNHNGNNVDIDLEMADLAKNQIYYNTLIERLNGRFNSIRTVLGQGR